MPPVVITGFQLFNELVLPGEDSPLEAPIENTQSDFSFAQGRFLDL